MNDSQMSNGTGATDPANVSAQVDNIISLHLHLWPDLTAAIQNGWGTSSPQQGEEVRAWLAGQLSSMFEQKQIRDVEDLEDILEQVMAEEYDMKVEDGTLEEVSRNIWAGRNRVLQGDMSEVDQLMGVWEERQKKKVKVQIQQGPDVDQDTDDEEEDGNSWNGFDDTNDVEMGDAPPPAPKQKVEPEIDEDGFTKVVGKKKR